MPWGGAWVSVGPGLVHVGGMVTPAEHQPALALDALVRFALNPLIGGYLSGRLEGAGPE